MVKKLIMLLFISLNMGLFATPAMSAPEPIIGIIIDDMGNHAYRDTEIVKLPGSVTCSILPYTFYSIWIANKAHAANKEIIAHIPMQAIRGEYLGRAGLTTHYGQQQFDKILLNDLMAVPYAEGLSNHMGSLLTAQPKQMDWLMDAIKPTGLFYVDSRTTSDTVAEKTADLDHVPAIRRNVFLDDIPTHDAIAEQFSQLIWLAKKQGIAVAIGHPYPATIEYLQQELPKLKQQGIMLVPLSQLVADREYMRQQMRYMHSNFD